MLYRLLILFFSTFLLANCTLLDRGGKGEDVADLEPIPEETVGALHNLPMYEFEFPTF